MPLSEEIQNNLNTITAELAKSGVLTKAERNNVIRWTGAMLFCITSKDAKGLKNYQKSLNAMIGVAELRATMAAEKALLKVVKVGVDVLVKAAIAAIL